ncbi:putative ABI family protein [Helianthus annuus]|nr:putative ABI family protein [Helianthus annuus]
MYELKNIRPQLYSAAEYCEKSYLHSEQKQVVLDNLKDYAVRALVNAVGHLGTVAYKLTDLLEQQTLEISTTGLHISCLHQVQTGAKQSHFQSRPRQFVSGTPAANTLCWHLASETKSTYLH